MVRSACLLLGTSDLVWNLADAIEASRVVPQDLSSGRLGQLGIFGEVSHGALMSAKLRTRECLPALIEDKRLGGNTVVRYLQYESSQQKLPIGGAHETCVVVGGRHEHCL